MKNKLYPVILLLSVVFLVQGESTGQISIGLPEAAATTVATTTTVPALPSNTFWIIVPLILAVAAAYVLKKWF